MNTIKINGVDVPIDTIMGPTNDDLAAAYRRHNRARMQSQPSSMQGSGSRFVGTPRHQKHSGDASAYGVRIK